MTSKKKSIKEALKLLNEMLSKGAAELNDLKKKVGKGWLTKGMYDNSVDVYKKKRMQWNKDSRDLKSRSITPDSIFSKYGKGDTKKSKSTLSFVDIAKGKGSRDEQSEWKNERLARVGEYNKKKKKEEEEK